MPIFIGVFGIFLILAGITLIVKPAIVFTILAKYSNTLGLYAAAIAVRLLVGGTFIYLSSYSGFPITFIIIGWTFIIAAAVFAIIGWSRFKKLMSWVLATAKPFSRLAGVLSACFGSFLIYVFL